MQSVHKSVLLKETIEGLSLGKGGTVLDGTLGGGGHSLGICERYPEVKIIALDKDEEALSRAKDKFAETKCKISFTQENFRNLDKVLNGEKVGGIVLDLGLSSDQFENSGRGFSFMRDEPLLMTMKANPSSEDITAHEVVNFWEEGNLADIIYGYGEEQFAKRIAKGIVEARKYGEIKTTFDLVKLIESSVPNFYKKGKIHPATKTFQAIRIAVNDELGALSEGLRKGFDALSPGGRFAVISFHSLEDRMVKNFFKMKAKDGEGILHTKKPITPILLEKKENPRSRSAKLRILEKR